MVLKLSDSRGVQDFILILYWSRYRLYNLNLHSESIHLQGLYPGTHPQSLWCWRLPIHVLGLFVRAVSFRDGTDGCHYS